MKKLLVVLLALTALSVAAFAEDVSWTWGLTVKTGAVFTLGDTTSYPQALVAINDADDAVLSRVRFDAEAALGDFSAHVRVGGDYAGNALIIPVPNTGQFLPAWWATAKLFDKMVEVRAGMIDNAVTDTVYQGWGGTSANGFQLVVLPIEGLKIAVGIPVDQTDANSGLDTIAVNVSTAKAGFAYTMPDLVTVKATWLNTPGEALSDLAAGADVLAVPDLTAQIETLLTNLGAKNTDAAANYRFTEYFAYKLDALKPSIELDQKIWVLSNAKMTLSFKPAVDYMVMDGVNVGASVKYSMNPATTAPLTETSSLVIDPYVKFTFNDKAKLKIDGAYTIPDLSATSVWNLPINVNFMFSY